MRINTNVHSLQAQRAVSEHSKKIEDSSGKLSSGVRVRSAADDAASLSINFKQQSQIRSQYQAARNANDVISEFQVAEGGMQEIGNMLIRLKELSVQAASDHLMDEERGMLNQEYMALRNEIERETKVTRLRGDQLIRPTGNDRTRVFQIGTSSDATSKMVVNQEDFGLTEFNLSIVDSSVPTAEEARINLQYIDKAIENLATNRARVGAVTQRLSSTVSNLEISRENTMSANSKVMDTDYALEVSEKLNSERKLSAATSVLSQANNLGANAMKLINGQ